MKTLTKLSTSSVFIGIVIFIFSAISLHTEASAQVTIQEKATPSSPQPLPIEAPARRPQNAQNTQQDSRNSAAPKSGGATTDPKKTSDSKSESAPPHAVDNKIAVSDPGAPGEKSPAKKPTAPRPPASKKATDSKGVTPK